MTFPRIFLIGSVAIFLLIGMVSIFKNSGKNTDTSESKPTVQISSQEEILLIDEEKESSEKIDDKKQIVAEEKKSISLPTVDHIDRLFASNSSKLPFVETVTYSSRVPWLKGRPAWIADYAAHYETTRHFIARSLNKNRDYFTQKVVPGDKFNVLKKDADIQFHLVIDLSRSKMWFYVYDKPSHERMLLKIYPVGLGRKDDVRPSGYLTPKGKYTLGGKVAIYKPGIMGYFQDRKIEMVRIFGTRWIPFGEEITECSEPAKGYGLHGAPWIEDKETKMLVEDLSKIKQYDSDGCIRLTRDDIEELFAIVISKPSFIELVDDFSQATLPGKEVSEFTKGGK